MGGHVQQCVVKPIVAVEFEATVTTTPSAVLGFDHTTKEPSTSIHIPSIGAAAQWPVEANGPSVAICRPSGRTPFSGAYSRCALGVVDF